MLLIVWEVLKVKKDNVNIFVIGIGLKINIWELWLMVSWFIYEYFFKVIDFYVF